MCIVLRVCTLSAAGNSNSLTTFINDNPLSNRGPRMVFLRICEKNGGWACFWRFPDPLLRRKRPLLDDPWTGNIGGQHNRILLWSLFIRRLRHQRTRPVGCYSVPAPRGLIRRAIVSPRSGMHTQNERGCRYNGCKVLQCSS